MTADNKPSFVEFENVPISHQSLLNCLRLNLSNIDLDSKEGKYTVDKAIASMSYMIRALDACSREPKLHAENPLLQAYVQEEGSYGDLKRTFALVVKIIDSRGKIPEGVSQQIIVNSQQIAAGIFGTLKELGQKGLFVEERKKTNTLNMGHVAQRNGGGCVTCAAVDECSNSSGESSVAPSGVTLVTLVNKVSQTAKIGMN